MDYPGKNKENQLPTKNMKITDCFRVKKCLFDSSKPEFASPTNELVLAHDSSDADSPSDSPYSLFNICKKRSLKTDCLKSLNRSNKSSDETPHKRSNVIKQLSHNMDVSMESPIRSCTSNLAEIIEKDMSDITLRGDFSQPCILPFINGKHPDLKSISIHTVNLLLNRQELPNFTIIDCRYPYEFEAGHIKNAINLFHKGAVEEYFFKSVAIASQREENKLLIFYCEFSSERAPNMMRFIRNLDRYLNEGSYPSVYYPELYLIEGGYKSFFSDYKYLCEPQHYKPMLDKNHSESLNFYRAVSKSWSIKWKKGKRYLMADSNSQRTLFTSV